MAYNLAMTLPGEGAADLFRDFLRGVAVDGTGSIYAVGDKRAIVLDAGDGKLRRSWKTEGAGLCVAVGPERQVYVGGLGRIDVFNAHGDLVHVWRDADRLGRVTEIAFFKSDILVADTTGRCIRRFDASGTWRNDIGTAGRLRGFFIPNGHLDFAIDADGVVHACNPAKHRVERYSLDGALLGHFGRWGNRGVEDFSGCCNPTNLALLGDSHVVVSEKAPPRVKVYDRTGEFVTLIESKTFHETCKNMDLAVDASGRLVVADTARRSILVFESTPSAPPPPSSNESTPAGASAPGGSRP